MLTVGSSNFKFLISNSTNFNSFIRSQKSNNMNLLKQWICLSLFAIPFWCFGQELASDDQQADTQQVAEKLIIEPNPLSLKIGETREIKVLALDRNNLEIPSGALAVFPLRSSGAVPTSGVLADSSGSVTGMEVGSYSLSVIWTSPDNQFLLDYLTVDVDNWAPASIEISNVPEELPVGSTIDLNLEVLDEQGETIPDGQVVLTSSKPEIISVDDFNQLRALRPGKAQIQAVSGKVKASVKLSVVPSRINSITINCDHSEVRTGDVVYFEANAIDMQGGSVQTRFSFSVTGSSTSEGGGALVREDGAFVAEKPGFYTINAMAGGRLASKSIKVVPRNVQSEIEVVGRGTMTRKHTTDFWLWEGQDGRDYAVTGTYSADGMAYFWDITDPGAIGVVDSIQVDARIVNDVKISEDGLICVISREGASSRKNGIVILDVRDPRNVSILSEYHEQLTGGVHNLFIYRNHVYALSNGQHYEIINIEDPASPYRVGRFEIDNPARAIHDVWIQDGIAYSSNWNDGVIMVDVGNGVAGGSPSNPVEIARSKVVGDANHTTFPFRSESASKFYVVAGDEIFPVEWFTKGLTETLEPRGYVHIIDWTDRNNPLEVATYRVPEAGAHNYWVEDETLYIGYYTGGIRAVDLSGELMGDLYRQGREMGYFIPRDPHGKVPNMAMTWGARPYKGHVFFTDMNSGLWAVKVTPKQPEETPIDIRD